MSEQLDAVLQKALAKDPAERYPTALAFKEALIGLRKWPLEQVQSEMAEQAERDFNSDAMAAYFETTPLPALDRAWREYQPPHTPNTHSDTKELTLPAEPLSARDPASPVEARRPIVTTVAAPSSQARVIWFVAGVAFLGTVIALALWVVQRNTPETPVVVYASEKRGDDKPGVAAEPSAPTQSSASTTPGASAQTSQERSSSVTKRVPRVPSKNALLSAAFAKQAHKVSICFEQNQTDKLEQINLAVDFSISEKGEVQTVGLSPKNLEALPLGQCLLKVARETTFPVQEGPVQFKIPITTRKAR